MAVTENQKDFLVTKKTQKGRRDAIRIPEFIEQLQNMVDKDPGKSIRYLALKLTVDEKSIQSCVHECIRHKFYTFKKNQFMNGDTREPSCCARSSTLKPLTSCLCSVMRRTYARFRR